jgi:predicted Zn-dependent peptidase
LETAISEELTKLGQERVDPAVLDRARVKLATDQLRSLRDNGTLARMLTFYQTVAGDWHYLTTYADRVAAITPEDLRQTAARYFVGRNRTVVTLSREDQP